MSVYCGLSVCRTWFQLLIWDVPSGFQSPMTLYLKEGSLFWGLGLAFVTVTIEKMYRGKNTHAELFWNMILLFCERRVLKNWCFWTVVLEKTLASPLDCKEIQPVHPKGDQSWVFIGRTNAEAEIPIVWPPHEKNWLIGKDPDAGRDWGQEEKGMTEDEMAGWHHWLDGRESEWTLGVGDGQGGLVCCDSWGCKELDTTKQLNWTEQNWSTSPKAAGYSMVVLNAYALRILLHAGEELSGDLGLSFPEMILASERERPLYLQTENLIHLKSKSCIGKKSGLSTSKKQRDNTGLKIDSYIHLKRIGSQYYLPP